MDEENIELEAASESLDNSVSLEAIYKMNLKPPVAVASDESSRGKSLPPSLLAATHSPCLSVAVDSTNQRCAPPSIVSARLQILCLSAWRPRLLLHKGAPLIEQTLVPDSLGQPTSVLIQILPPLVPPVPWLRQLAQNRWLRWRKPSTTAPGCLLECAACAL